MQIAVLGLVGVAGIAGIAGLQLPRFGLCALPLAHAAAHPCAAAACTREIVPDDFTAEGRSPGMHTARIARLIAERAPESHIPGYERAMPAITR